MWTAIGVGILLVAQAGALPATAPKGAAAAPAAAAAKPAATTGADEPGTATEVPATAANGEATLRFRNDVGDSFQMTEARFSLDGRLLPTQLTSAARGQEYVIFTGPIAPGRHVITSHISYQGQNRAAIFTYMRGFTFNLDSTHEMNVPEGGTTVATIVGRTNKGFNVPFEHSLIVEMEPPTGLSGAH